MRVGAFAPDHGLPRPLRQLFGQRQYVNRLMLSIPLETRTWATASNDRGFCRFVFTPPSRRLRTHVYCISQLLLREPIAKCGFIAIDGIRQHDTLRNTPRQSRLYLRSRNLPFGSECNLFRYASLATAISIFGSLRRQIQLVCQRQAAVVIGERQADCYLTVVRLTQTTTILTCHSD